MFAPFCNSERTTSSVNKFGFKGRVLLALSRTSHDAYSDSYFSSVKINVNIMKVQTVFE